MQRTGGIADAPQLETGVDWRSPRSVKPSAAGLKGGVILVAVSAGTFALKAANDDAAGIVFGERVLAAVGGPGVVTPDSIPVPVGSDEGQQIISMLEGAAGLVGGADRGSFAAKLDGLRRARFVVVQTALHGTGFDAATEADPGNVLPVKGAPADDGLNTRLRNLGRTLAGDILIGNADRLDQINPGNIFLEGRDQVGAIDTEALLMNRDEQPGINQEYWVDRLVMGGETFVEPEEGEGKPTSRAQQVLNFDDWFDDTFRRYFEGLEVVGDEAGLDAYDLDAVQDLMRAGFVEGLDDVTSRLRDKAQRRELRQGLKAAEQAYGPSPTLDWHAMKVKGRYIESAHAGAGHRTSLERANAEADYLIRSKPALKLKIDAVLVGPKAELWTVPELPGEMSRRRKTVRSLIPRGAADKQAKKLKKELRAGDKDADAVDLTLLAGTGRRGEKAVFEVRFRQLLGAYARWTQALESLQQELDAAKSKPQDPIAVREAATICRVWRRSPTEKAAQDFKELAAAWRGAVEAEPYNRQIKAAADLAAGVHAKLGDDCERK